jgi:hypothetical protein
VRRERGPARPAVRTGGTGSGTRLLPFNLRFLRPTRRVYLFVGPQGHYFGLPQRQSICRPSRANLSTWTRPATSARSPPTTRLRTSPERPPRTASGSSSRAGGRSSSRSPRHEAARRAAGPAGRRVGHRLVLVQVASSSRPARCSTSSRSSRRGPLETLLDEGGWWTIARQHQQYVRALHESAVYVGWDPEIELPTFELVTPDFLTIDASPYNRTRPITVWWARTRTITGGNGRHPVRVVLGSVVDRVGRADVLDLVERPDARPDGHVPGGGEVRRGQHGRQAEGREGQAAAALRPVPRSWAGAGIVEPNLPRLRGRVRHVQVGLLWTAVVHGVLRASWSQRVILNGKVKGGTTETVAGYAVRVVKPDPTAILQIDGENAAIARVGHAARHREGRAVRPATRTGCPCTSGSRPPTCRSSR